MNIYQDEIRCQLNKHYSLTILVYNERRARTIIKQEREKEKIMNTVEEN